MPEIADLLRESGQVVFRYRLRPDRGFDYLSPSIAAITGFPADAFHLDPRLVHRLILPEDRRLLRASMRPGAGPHHVTLRWRAANDRIVLADHVHVLAHDHDGAVVAVEGIARRVEPVAPTADAGNYPRLRGLTVALIRIQRLLTGELPETEVFDAASRLLVEVGGVAMAWVGLVEPGTQHVRCFGGHGDHGFLDEIDAIDDTRAWLEGIGTAIRSSAITVVEDVETDARMDLFREPCLRHGYRSIAAFPVRLGSVTIGVLAAYARQPAFFGFEELAIVEQIVAAVSAALTAADEERRRRAAEHALSLSESRARSVIELAPVGVMTYRAGFYETNSACRAMFGWTDEMEFPTAAPKDWVVPRDQAAVAGKLTPVLRGASSRASFEATALRSDGSEFPLLVEAARIELDDGPVIVTFLADLSQARHQGTAA